MKNKKAWIRIVEAFISVMLIAAVLLIVLNKGYIGKEDISARIYDIELSILREIELDQDLRDDILNVVILPKGYEDVGFPANVKTKINERTPEFLECEARICEMDSICSLEEYLEKDIFSQSVGITANLETYNPRQLKLFCWVN